MSTLSATLTPSTAATATTMSGRASVRALLRVSLVATVTAAAATEALTALVRTAGVDLAVGDPGGSADSVVPVTAGACAISIAICMVVGTAVAAVINWRSSRPARTYRILTGVLVAASLLAPLAAAGTETATKITLICAHLVAAAVIIPMVSGCLAGRR